MALTGFVARLALAQGSSSLKAKWVSEAPVGPTIASRRHGGIFGGTRLVLFQGFCANCGLRGRIR